ncbi:MAG: hypothetical protein QNI96_05230 [Woeseiaceae bacterium]|nr:hypothetical protein [Woeseiaceae bacterium]
MNDRNKIINELETRVHTMKGVLDRFAAEIRECPRALVHRSDTMFVVVARLEAAEHLLKLFKSDRDYATIQKLISNRIMNFAANPKNSTSPAANLYHQELTAKYADEFDGFHGVLSADSLLNDFGTEK